MNSLHVPVNFCENTLVNYFNMKPSEVKGSFNLGANVYKRYLWNLIYSVFEFDIPDEWALNFFRFWLFQYGSIAVLYTKKFGWVCMPYGIVKLDLYYQPFEIVVNNRLFDAPKIGRVGVNCGIVKIMDDFYGLDDIVRVYAETLANIDGTVKQNLMNSRVAYYMEVGGKKEAEEFKTFMEKIYSGEPYAYLNRDLLNGKESKLVFNNVKNTYIVRDLLESKRQVVNEFLTKIGIPNANLTKKERMITDEVNQNNDETKSLCSIMLENIKLSFKKIEKMTDNIKLDVKLRFDEDGRGEQIDNIVRNV